MGQLNEALKDLGDFNPLTIKFLEILAENKRLSMISDVAATYAKLYKTLNKEEKITIISAVELSSDERAEVLSALQANPDNSGKEFTLDFTLEPTIKGGL
jgi:F-type H+-transporting ATPase subunit delta